jgi:hypothetical protein
MLSNLVWGIDLPLRLVLSAMQDGVAVCACVKLARCLCLIDWLRVVYILLSPFEQLRLALELLVMAGGSEQATLSLCGGSL